MDNMEVMQERRGRSFRGSLWAANSSVSRFGDSMPDLNNGGDHKESMTNKIG